MPTASPNDSTVDRLTLNNIESALKGNPQSGPRAPASPSDSAADRLTFGNIVAALDKRRAIRPTRPLSQDSPTKELKVVATTAWMARLTAQARRRQLSLAEYVQKVLMERLQNDESDDPDLAK